MGYTLVIEEIDPAKKVLNAKPGGNERE